MPWYITDMDDVPGDMLVPDMQENGFKAVLMLVREGMTLVNFGEMPFGEAEVLVAEMRVAEGEDDEEKGYVAAVEVEDAAGVSSMNAAQVQTLADKVRAIHLAETLGWKHTRC